MKRELLIIITLSLIISGCVDQEPTPADSTQMGLIETELIDLSDITGENTEFIKYYSLQPLKKVQNPHNVFKTSNHASELFLSLKFAYKPLD